MVVGSADQLPQVEEEVEVGSAVQLSQVEVEVEVGSAEDHPAHSSAETRPATAATTAVEYFILILV